MSKAVAGACIITGASAGLGVAFAKRFAARGHDLLLVARREDRLRALADELSARHKVQCRVLAVDLMDPTSPPKVLAAIDEAGWTPEILVNNAGFGANGNFHELPIERNLGQVRLNVEALTHLCALFAPRFVAQRRGRILNIASTAAFQPGPGMSVYCATKAYVLSLSEGIAQELAGTGVQVTAYCPGPVHTEFASIARNDATMLFRQNVATPDEVVEDALRAMDLGQVVAIHGAINTLVAQLPRIVPRSFVRRAAAKVLQRMEP